MGISNQTTEKVKERLDIEEVINDYVPLKKKGQNLWACCPFHNEKSPSFSVSPAKQIYKCFGCGKAGDAIQFVMEIEGVGFSEAIKQLALKYGIEVEEEHAITPEEVKAYNERESLYIALAFARDFFIENLESEEGQSIGNSYFVERGFSPGIIAKFELGYALRGWDHLLNKAKSLGFSEDILIKAGLVLEHETDKTRVYDRFRERVIFPIHNLGGKPVGFGARILSQDKKQPKYINSPETAVYNKSDILYGLFHAKQAIKQKDNCYLVEGYTDVISLHLSGIENVVSTSGTSLTENQIRLIKRFTDHVTVLFDGDAAGIKASLRGIDMLLEGGLLVKAVVFPNGEDPDSYSKKVGSDGFKQYLQTNTQDFITFKIGLYKEEIERDPIKRAELVRQVVTSISKIPDPLVRSIYTKESSRMLDLGEDIIHTELNKILLKSQKDQFFKGKQDIEVTQLENLLPVWKKEPDGGKSLEAQEKETMRLLINYGFELVTENLHVCEYLIEETKDLKFETPVYREILKVYKRALLEGILPRPDYFIRSDNNEIKIAVIHLISEQRTISPNWKVKHQIHTKMETDDYPNTTFKEVLRLKSKKLKLMESEAREKMKLANEAEITELQMVCRELRKIISDIDNQLGTVAS